MNPLELILLIFSMNMVMFLSFYRLFKAGRRLRSKKTSGKRKGIEAAAKTAGENAALSAFEIGSGIFKHWF